MGRLSVVGGPLSVALRTADAYRRGPTENRQVTDRRPVSPAAEIFLRCRVGIWSRQSLLNRSCLMYLMSPNTEGLAGTPNELETIVLSEHHLDYLEEIARELNPCMPESFGLPHLIRTILDRVEESGIDLTEAGSEEEIARLAAGQLRQSTPVRRSRRTATERTSSSSYSAAPRSNRSSQPERDRSHSGKRPRSGRG